MAEHKHYSEYCEYMDGRVVLYKRRDHAKPRFTARLKIDGRVGYIVKGTKTTNKDKAYQIAKDWYYDYEGKFNRGEPIKKISFTGVFEEWKNNKLIEGKKKVYTKGDVARAEKNILSHYAKTDIRNINNTSVSKYFSNRQSQTPEPSANTLKQDVRLLKNILTFALNNDIITKLPTFPSFNEQPKTRPDFTQAQYDKLIKSMRQFVKDGKAHPMVYRARFYLQQFVLILKNSGMRVGEARQLTWADISKTQTVDGGTRLVFAVSGKTGGREVVCMKRVKDYITRLHVHRTKELGDKPSLNEHVFCHSDGKLIHSFKKSFRTLLEYSDLLYDSKGDRRVLYSLRHTYATMRLRDGVGIYQLATNMGTSVEMIERYYGKKRVTAKTTSELTKFGAGVKKGVASEKLAWE
jgi:integrase